MCELGFALNLWVVRVGLFDGGSRVDDLFQTDSSLSFSSSALSSLTVPYSESTPARSERRGTGRTSIPAGVSSMSSRSPSRMEYLSLNSRGMVVCPLRVTFTSRCTVGP